MDAVGELEVVKGDRPISRKGFSALGGFRVEGGFRTGTGAGVGSGILPASPKLSRVGGRRDNGDFEDLEDSCGGGADPSGGETEDREVPEDRKLREGLEIPCGTVPSGGGTEDRDVPCGVGTVLRVRDETPADGVGGLVVERGTPVKRGVPDAGGSAP